MGASSGRFAMPRWRQGTSHSAKLSSAPWGVLKGVVCLSGLLLGWGFLTANPQAIPRLLAPYSPTYREAWVIKTPADAELLIDKAKQSDAAPVDARVENTTRELMALLASKGVRILISDVVIDHAGGQWNPALGEIRIRPKIVEMGSPVLLEVLTHEAAHVAQSCSAGGLNRSAQPMGIPVSPAEVFNEQLNSPLYKGSTSNKVIELEAYTVQKDPKWAMSLLDHFCKR